MGDVTTTEPSVEGCLRELREMFPRKSICIRRDDSFYPADCRDGAETIRDVTVKIGYLESEPKFRSRSLSDCMAQIRAWHREQAKE